MNAFFWPRRASAHDLVRSVDALLDQLFPADVFADALRPDVDADTDADADATLLGSSPGTENETEDEAEVDGVDADADDPDDSSSDPETEAAQTIPEELERLWRKIRSHFAPWDDASAPRKEREKKSLRMTELLLRHHALEKTLLPKVMLAMTFETRKYVRHVFCALATRNLHGFVDKVAEHPSVLQWLIDGYRSNATALVCGAMLRDCLVHEKLAIALLTAVPGAVEVLVHVTKTNTNFDISTDAFGSVTHVLMDHKKATVVCLDEGFDRIFGALNTLLAKDASYVTKRQALQLLSELLLDPVNFAIMQRYVASRDNLKVVMMLLREPSEALRMDAFHVFKIFVANPNKSPEVEQLLLRNSEKLLVFVGGFGKQEVRRDFLQEKQLLLFTLRRLAEKEKGRKEGNSITEKRQLKTSLSSPASPATATASSSLVTLSKSTSEV